MTTAVKLAAAFALGFVIGVLRLPWEIATELKGRKTRCH